ncbi:hypothetical protein BDP27DRAFT_1363582 [Rhodocollybia butyracea]|uniref:Uncharacterized protein n=1 Tax=Rhodocollybia butyracea TaxID=206335 RepID=A0A9P5PTE4_9AGAR|nr:hypothetical protein BDP27DRAFT_1363582 [Rhodocollybia butyracea]
MVRFDQIDEDHPLVLEISSLKAAVSRFQDEAHSASLKLQRFSFDTSTAQDRVAHLQRENELLRTELATLRQNPHPDLSPTSHPAVLQSQELTLSLRRLSDKLSLTELVLLERTTELAHIASEVAKSKHTVEGAYALAARTRGREEEGKVRERELEMKIRELKEELKMEDLVVKEYADLVRSLEGRNGPTLHTESASIHSNGSSATLVDGISEGKAGLQRLFADFSGESERLHAEAEQLKGELAATNSQLEAERKGSEADRIHVASLQKELQMLKVEDKSAAAMVSRYMKFTQASTNTLQNSVATLKARHSATIDTFSNQLANLTAQLQSSQATSEKLRTTLDELGRDIMRESYGRRREIALRLKLVVREEALQESLGRWIRRAQEVLDQEQDQIPRLSFEKLLSDARDVYAVLDTPAAAIAPLPPVSESDYSPYSAPTGSLARIIATETSLKSLIEELQIQTARRQELEIAVAANEPLPPLPVKDRTYTNGRVKARSVSVAMTTETVSTEETQRPSETSNEVIQHPEASYSFDATPLESKDIPDESELIMESVSENLAVAEINNTGDKQSLNEVDALINAPGLIALPSLEETDLDASLAAHEEAGGKQSLDEADALINAPGPIAFPSIEEADLDASLAAHEEEALVVDRNPLLDELTHVSHRYDDLQRAFRDCHLALQELRRMISVTDASDLSVQAINGIPSQIFAAAVERLDNYNEDARVELEIRAADECLLAQGYQTMLSLNASSIPNLPSPSSTSSYSFARSFSQDTLSDSEPTASELEAQIRDFASGADLNVQRAQQSLSRKLTDVQNDIAVLKRAIHDRDAFEPSSPSTTPTTNGNGWTSWIRGTTSRPDSPSPAPTFGHVMTSPRLKHSSSFHHDLGSSRRGSVTDPSSHQAHPFANLDLRVSMPAFSSPSSSRSATFSPPGIDWHGPRTRTISTMNMLGLGTAAGSPQLQRSASLTSEVTNEDSEDEVE